MNFRLFLLLFVSLSSWAQQPQVCLPTIFHDQLHGSTPLKATSLPDEFVYNDRTYSLKDAPMSFLGGGIGGGPVHRVTFSNPPETLTIKMYRDQLQSDGSELDRESVMQTDLDALDDLRPYESRLRIKVATMKKTGVPGLAVIGNHYGAALYYLLANPGLSKELKEELTARFMKLLFDLKAVVKEENFWGIPKIDAKPGYVLGLPHFVLKGKTPGGNRAIELRIHVKNILVDLNTLEFTLIDPN